MTTTQPDFFAIVQGAFRDGWPLMRSRMPVYWALAALCAVLTVATLWLVRPGDPTAQEQVRLHAALEPANLCAAIAAFFAIPAAIRTVRPEFKMTFVRILAIIGISIVVGVVTEIGFVLLIVPGIWVGVKLALSTWTYLAGEGKNPFGESWEITTGHFWETFAFFVVLSVLVTLALVVVFFIPICIAYFVPISAVIFGPLGFLGYVYAYNVSSLGELRWMLELRRAVTGAAI